MAEHHYHVKIHVVVNGEVFSTQSYPVRAEDKCQAAVKASMLLMADAMLEVLEENPYAPASAVVLVNFSAALNAGQVKFDVVLSDECLAGIL